MPAPAHPNRFAVVPAVCLGLSIVVAVAAVLGGAKAAAGAAVGLVLVVLFFLSGRIPVRLGPDVPVGMSYLLLLFGYILRIMLLLLAFRALRDADWLDRRVLGGTVIAGAMLWIGAQLRAHIIEGRPPAGSTAPGAPPPPDDMSPPDGRTPSDDRSRSGERTRSDERLPSDGPRREPSAPSGRTGPP